MPILQERCYPTDLFNLSRFEVLNTHNYVLNRSNIIEISEEVARIKSRDFLAPGNSISFFVGDFNFPHRNELPFILGKPQLDLHSPVQFC